jgi:NHL repeat-containing protein
MRAGSAALVLALVPPAAAAAQPPVRAVTLPRTAVVEAAWHVALRASAAPLLLASGPGKTLRVRTQGSKGLYRAVVRFPRAGAWKIAASLRGRSATLGTVAVDVARDPLLVDPFTIAVDGSGSILVGQMDKGPLLRVVAGRATPVADGVGIFHVAVAGGRTYVAASDGAVYRVDGSAFARVTPVVDAGAVAVDGAGNVYAAVYAGWIRKITPGGVVTSIAGTGVEGYSGDGGPATSAKLFHPHSLALGPDGAIYVADTENRRIRRIDLRAGTITTFGGDVGVTVSIAVAADGTVWSADVRRDGTGGGITRTTAQGVTSRIATIATVNGVAVAPDGTVYVNQWEDKRVGRLDPRSGVVEPVARG